MTARLPVPISELARRMPEQGRIRIGVKTNDRNHPMKAIGTFRLTSSDKTAIERAAELYGGTPLPWEDGPRAGEWDLITEKSVLPIILPPDPLSGTPIYELWSGGGLVRRCDGVTCSLPVGTPDGQEYQEAPCVCMARKGLECKPKTRLNVVLRELPFGGTWRFETGSEISAREMPGMVDMIAVMQDKGFQLGLMSITDRVTKTKYWDKKTNQEKVRNNRFKVVALAMESSIEAMAAGLNSVGALGGGTQAPALGVGASSGTATSSPGAVNHDSDPDYVDPYAGDDEVIEGELVEDDLGSTVKVEDTKVEGGNQNLETALIMRIKELVAETMAGDPQATAIDDSEVRHDLVEQHTAGTRGPDKAVRSSLQMTDLEKHQLMERIDGVLKGELRFGWKDGKWKIGRRS